MIIALLCIILFPKHLSGICLLLNKRGTPGPLLLNPPLISIRVSPKHIEITNFRNCKSDCVENLHHSIKLLPIQKHTLYKCGNKWWSNWSQKRTLQQMASFPVINKDLKITCLFVHLYNYKNICKLGLTYCASSNSTFPLLWREIWHDIMLTMEKGCQLSRKDYIQHINNVPLQRNHS